MGPRQALETDQQFNFMPLLLQQKTVHSSMYMNPLILYFQMWPFNQNMVQCDCHFLRTKSEYLY